MLLNGLSNFAIENPEIGLQKWSVTEDLLKSKKNNSKYILMRNIKPCNLN